MDDGERTGPRPPPRTARLVLVLPDGTVVGQLPPVPISTPWWFDVGPVVAAIFNRYGIDVTILRLLEAELAQPHGGPVTYLAEITRVVPANTWNGTLDEHPLRQQWARPGGPALDLAWAKTVLERNGFETAGAPEQVRSWNLSSLWRILTSKQAAWLKVVPPFFAHEGDILAALKGEPVPTLLGHDGGRILMAEVGGTDMYDAGEPGLLGMVSLLVHLQQRWLGRSNELQTLGLPDWRTSALIPAIADVVERTSDELPTEVHRTLDKFVRELPRRLISTPAA